MDENIEKIPTVNEILGEFHFCECKFPIFNVKAIKIEKCRGMIRREGEQKEEAYITKKIIKCDLCGGSQLFDPRTSDDPLSCMLHIYIPKNTAPTVSFQTPRGEHLK